MKTRVIWTKNKVFGHVPELHLLREPSWTFMDPQMDPKMDPARLILEDYCRLKALLGPSKVQSDQFFFIDLRTMDKLKNTAWFEVNRLQRNNDLDLLWAICPPPCMISVNRHSRS